MAIWHPKIGQRVTLNYRLSLKPHLPDGCTGTVRIVGRGRRAVNVLVDLDDGRKFVVPRGNLIEAKTSP